MIIHSAALGGSKQHLSFDNTMLEVPREKVRKWSITATDEREKNPFLNQIIFGFTSACLDLPVHRLGPSFVKLSFNIKQYNNKA